MTERILKDYFRNLIDVTYLSNDLKGSSVISGHNTTTLYIDKLSSETSFVIIPTHIEKLLRDTLNKFLTIQDLKTIAGSLMFSDHFTWDSDNEVGERIATIINELDNSEINYPITNKNLELWLEYLKSGKHKLQQ